MGTVYGQVIQEDRGTNRLENIEMSLSIGHSGEKWSPVLTNAKGEYRFEKCVPVHLKYIVIMAKYESGASGGTREITEIVDGIAGVKRFLGFPISSGTPKRVDFVIPDIPPPIIGNE